MTDDDEFRGERNARLDALGLRGHEPKRDATCVHCGRSFMSCDGHVSEEVSLCDYCLHKN